MATEQGTWLSGQQFNPRFPIVVPFRRKMFEASNWGNGPTELGNAATDIQPNDAKSAIVTEYLLDGAFSFYLENLVERYDGTENIQLPDVLTRVDVLFNEGQGNGAGNHPTSQQETGFVVSGTIELSPRSTAQASANIIPSVSPTIVPYSDWGQNSPVQSYSFYVVPPASYAYILARTSRFVNAGTAMTFSLSGGDILITSATHDLADTTKIVFSRGTEATVMPTGVTIDTVYFIVSSTTNTFKISLTSGGAPIASVSAGSGTVLWHRQINAWPKFKPLPVNFVSLGQQFSVRQSADSVARATLSGSSFSLTRVWGDEYSKDVGLSNQIDRIPPTLHAALNLQYDGSDFTVPRELEGTTTVVANTRADTDIALDAITNEPTPITVTATGDVNPKTLAATSPTTVPTSGLYLYSYRVVDNEYGQGSIRAIVVDMSQYA